GLVYCNPPYGRALKVWAQKFRDEGAAGTELLVLVPARTDTAWFRLLTRGAGKARRVCLLDGRLKFGDAKAPAPFPSAVAYWGKRVDAFEEAFDPHGWV